MTTFVQFRETCDWEGETWCFWLQADGNIPALVSLSAILEEYAEQTDDQYSLDLDVELSIHDVNVLVEYGDPSDDGYHSAHTRVTGKLHLPDDLLIVDVDGYKDLPKLYKGGIVHLFQKEEK